LKTEIENSHGLAEYSTFAPFINVPNALNAPNVIEMNQIFLAQNWADFMR